MSLVMDRPAALVAGGGGRRLTSYPKPVIRYSQLLLSVAATIVLYYELYVQGSVSPQILADLHMSFNFLVYLGVVGNACGAAASVAAGLADRWGRANIVVYGLLITGAITLFGLPHATGRYEFALLTCLLSVVEGAVLVATPALIRDYSPQLGRGSAMGFWTMGPVLGSLVVSEVASGTLRDHANWRFQFYVCGTVGLIVAVVALLALRELSPAIRDQIMVSANDRALIEARAAGASTTPAEHGGLRQMLTPRVTVPALGISLFLLVYYVLVGFFVVFALTVLGYSSERANALANWYWATQAIALIVTGFVSDKLRVRKPFMVTGALIAVGGLIVFTTWLDHPLAHSYYSYATVLAIAAAGGGMAYTGWMAAFTETVEHRNPAATAAGLAVWGMILRSVVSVSVIVLAHVVTASSPLVDKGATVQRLAATYAKPLAILQSVSPKTAAALKADPADAIAQAEAVSEVAGHGITPADVARAATLQAQYPAELATLAAINPAAGAAYTANPKDTAALVTIVTGLAAKFHVNQSQATIRLIELSEHVPTADVAFLTAKGEAITTAATGLTNANKAVPAADLAYLTTNAPTVLKAQSEAPRQWQDWFWVCVVGQLLFLLTIPLLRGRWSPRKAASDAREHARAVELELARLNTGDVTSIDLTAGRVDGLQVPLQRPTWEVADASLEAAHSDVR